MYCKKKEKKFYYVDVNIYKNFCKLNLEKYNTQHKIIFFSVLIYYECINVLCEIYRLLYYAR